MKKIVLAYSGGLDTSVAIHWLKEKYQAEIIAMSADVGQEEELAPLKEKALASGASKIYIEDLREEFMRDFVFPLIKSGALYEQQYLLGTAIARPVIAKRLVEVAEKEGAEAVAHGATGKGNDQVRFELTVKALAPHLHIIAPWREWEIRSREDAIDYANKYGIPVPVTKEKPYSMDRNLWHISYEGGILEDPAVEPDKDMFLLSVDPEDAPDTPEYVEIGFVSGEPVSVNGKDLAPVELLTELNTIAGRHGIGRVDMVEIRLVGMKSRGVYETPGGTLLYFAHKQLESLTLDRETMHFKEMAAVKYGELVYYGLWYTPLREALDAFINVTQKNVTGSIRLKLYKGNISVAGRTAPRSLYREDLATFGADAVYNQRDAEGFINLFGLPLKVQGLLAQSLKKQV
ncbi:MAG: argininosuccinate synthase [Firmicutes bacterium]|nr:argininosuccinate synthase [Bacillota bacterium]